MVSRRSFLQVAATAVSLAEMVPGSVAGAEGSSQPPESQPNVPQPALLRTEKGEISGVVRDASGAPISNVSVTLADLGTGRRTQLQTNESGLYQGSLDVGTYRIRVEKVGFKPFQVPGLWSRAGKFLRYDVFLEVGEVESDIEVDPGVGQTSQTPLFPTSLPASQWVELKAAGFPHPVPGVIYRGASSKEGVPLGGLGTGFMYLQTDGTLDYYSTIFNAFLEQDVICRKREEGEETGHLVEEELPTLRKPFLGLAVGGKTWVMSLQKVPGVERAKDIHYWGHYPVADVEYQTEAPVGVSLRAWTPFFPGDEAGSNTPGSIFQVQLHNGSNTTQTGRLGFSFHGPRQEEIAFQEGNVKSRSVPAALSYQREKVKGSFTGLVVGTKWGNKLYSYALGVIGTKDVEVGGELAGNGWNALSGTLPTPSVSDPGASIAVDFSLKPGETKTIPFVLGWYAPVWNGMFREANLTGYEYSNMYAGRFHSAGEVAEWLAGNHESLLQRILAWQTVIYSEQDLPGWLQDSLVNVLATLIQQAFWVTSTNPKHWWGSEGGFATNESRLCCPQMSCIANDEFADWPLDIFFPKLARNKLRQYKHYQKANGQVPSILGFGMEPDLPTLYDQLLSIDGQVYAQKVDRHWQVTGDDSMLKEFYPSVKAQMKFMFTVDRDGDGLPDADHGEYYDMWHMVGAAIHVSTYWLATLRIVERMAEKVGDQAFAEECQGWYKKGYQSIERELWNPKVGSYLLYNQPATGKYSDTVLSDQLIGQYFVHLHGLPPILPKDRVDTVLATLWRINLKPFGIRIALRPDGSDDNQGYWLSTNTCPSYATIIPASLQIYEGDPAKGLDLMHRTWSKLVLDLKMGWNMPPMLNALGELKLGLQYYHNTMLWTIPLTVLGQTLKSSSAPGGLAYRTVLAARG